MRYERSDPGAARERLLVPVGMDLADLEHVLGRLGRQRHRSADVYLEATRSESWSLEDGIVKEGVHSIRQGAGRARRGERTGFAYSDDLTVPALVAAADTARAITRQGQSRDVALAPVTPPTSTLYTGDDPLAAMPVARKLDVLRSLDQRVRAADPRVREVMVGLSGQYTSMLVANADGTLAADVRPLVRLNVTVIVEADGRRESATHGGGGRYDYAELFADERPARIADEALRQALVALTARAAPAGEMTVVLGNGWPGILLHEAIGHGLEGDFNRKGTSAFAGRIGEKVADEACTVVDDGTLPGRRGSLHIDDEGAATSCTVLIERGRLCGYMQDHNAGLMRAALTATADGSLCPARCRA